MVTAVRTDTDDFVPIDGEEDGYRWHATLHLCDPWTKVEIKLNWHESFSTREEAEEHLAEEMNVPLLPSVEGASIGDLRAVVLIDSY